MNREQDVQVDKEKSEPNLVKLSNGSYIQWDWKDGMYRVAYYERRTGKSSDLEIALSVATKKPLHNSKLKDIFAYISRTDEYAAVGTGLEFDAVST